MRSGKIPPEKQKKTGVKKLLFTNIIDNKNNASEIEISVVKVTG